MGGDGHARFLEREADRLADPAGAAGNDRNACHASLLVSGAAPNGPPMLESYAGPAHPSSTRASNVLSSAIPTALSRSEEHTSELQSLMRISYAVFCLKKIQRCSKIPTMGKSRTQ